jgi:predicted XRE-type DNA-binding protein
MLPDLPIVCPVRSADYGMEFFVLDHWFPEDKITLFLNKRYVSSTGCHISTLPNIQHKEYKVLAFRLQGLKINAKAHRLAWELFVAPIQDGMLICHDCDNPPCVNPSHLYEGSVIDNVADRDSKNRHGRHVKGGNFGLVHQDLMDEIKQLRNAGWTQQRIADKLGIGQSTVSEYLRKSLKE